MSDYHSMSSAGLSGFNRLSIASSAATMPVQTRRMMALQQQSRSRGQSRVSRATQDSDEDSDEEDPQVATALLQQSRLSWMSYFAVIALQQWLNCSFDKDASPSKLFLKTFVALARSNPPGSDLHDELVVPASRNADVWVTGENWNNAAHQHMAMKLARIQQSHGSRDEARHTGPLLTLWMNAMTQIVTLIERNPVAVRTTIKRRYADQILDVWDFIIRSDYNVLETNTRPPYSSLGPAADYNLYLHMVQQHAEDFCGRAEVELLLSGNATDDQIRQIEQFITAVYQKGHMSRAALQRIALTLRTLRGR